MKLLSIVLFAMFITACTSVSQQKFYSPANSNEKLSITGKSNLGFANSIDIFINGQKVASGTVHDFKNSDIFYGQYKENSVSAQCSQTEKWTGAYRIDCDVFIDNNLAAHLVF